MRDYRSSAAFMAASVLFATGGCLEAPLHGDDVVEELHIRYQHRDFVDELVIESASGCIGIDVGEDGKVIVLEDGFVAEGGSSDLSVKRVRTTGGLRVTGTSESAGNHVLFDKLYSLDFMRSKDTDAIDVQTSDRGYRIAHRGVLSCEEEIDIFAE